MPPVDDDFIILVCDCGKRLKAPGARPGRVGQCPACGGILRAPGDAPAERASAAPQADASSRRAPKPGGERPSPGHRSRPARPVAYGTVAASDVEHASERMNPSRAGLSPKDRPSAGPVGREGLVRAPKHAEDGLGPNLRYPLWDGNGLAMLFFLPPTLWLTSLLSIGLFPNYVIGADTVTKMGAITMIFPASILLTFTLGYVSTFLGEVVTSSAFGEVYHPRVPPWMLGTTLESVLRGIVSLAAGALVASPLMMAFLTTREAIGPGDWFVAALLAIPGVAYAQVALVAILLHGSLWAANPFTVFAALAKTGAAAMRLAMLLSLSAAATVLAAAALFWLGNRFGLIAVLVGTWVFWVAFLYQAMVLARVLGLFYRRYAERIGWFPDRPRWGVSA